MATSRLRYIFALPLYSGAVSSCYSPIGRDDGCSPPVGLLCSDAGRPLYSGFLGGDPTQWPCFHLRAGEPSEETLTTRRAAYPYSAFPKGKRS